MNDALRGALRMEAEDGVRGADAVACVQGAVSRYRRRRVKVAVAGTVAGLAVAVGVPIGLEGHDRPPVAAAPPPPPVRPIMDWPTRGDLAGDNAAKEDLLKRCGEVNGTNTILFIGHDRQNRGYGVVAFPLGDQVGYAVCQQAPPDFKKTRWLQMGAPASDTRTQAAAAAVTLIRFDSLSTTHQAYQFSLATPGYRISASSEMVAVTLDDRGVATFPAGTTAQPVDQVTDGVLIRPVAVPAGDMTGALLRLSAGASNLQVPTFYGQRRSITLEWGYGPHKLLRGLPQLLDAPQTFPGLDLWGRLHGLGQRPGYANPIWGGTLADGSQAALFQPTTPGGTSTAFSVDPPGPGGLFLVRDLRNATDSIAQISAYLPLSDGRCELVVVGRPDTTRIEYDSTGTGSFTDLPQPRHDAVGRLTLPTCDGHTAARLRITAGHTVTYRGPIDSTQPGAGIRH